MTDEQHRRKARRDLASLFAAEVSTWPSAKLRANLAQPEQVRAAEERERQARELPRRCETCAHWRRLRQPQGMGVCGFEAPMPTDCTEIDPELFVETLLPHLLDSVSRRANTVITCNAAHDLVAALRGLYGTAQEAKALRREVASLRRVICEQHAPVLRQMLGRAPR